MGAWFVAEVWPNLFASLLWAPLAFVGSHVLLRRHITSAVGAARPEPTPTMDSNTRAKEGAHDTGR
jgi:hypothetical protein